MTKEVNVQRLVSKGLRSVGVHVMRVSNTALPGTPDLAFVAHGKDGWLELKIGEITTGRLAVKTQTKQQVAWMRDHARVSGRAFTLVRMRYEWLLFDASGSQIMADMKIEDARGICRWIGGRPISWHELSLALASVR